jgi:uncharacterized membrane protein YhaH (DUF805 family)
MKLADMFFSARGRLARQPFWLGMLTLLAVVLAANVAAILYDAKAAAATPPAQWYRIGALLVMAAIAWPSYALIAKRLQDRGQRPWAAVAYSVLVLALHAVDAVYPLETPKGDLLWPGILIGVPLVLVIVALVIEGMRRGDIGPNDYGPDPAGTPADGLVD